ncbi:hypothetical protein GQ42DRAFT_8338 [Ramicandelaber brevisporus]|nr:hypothetical protein GQ42DRAFT_8338 [Ramicandelaber brevisporus]
MFLPFDSHLLSGFLSSHIATSLFDFPPSFTVTLIHTHTYAFHKHTAYTMKTMMRVHSVINALKPLVRFKRNKILDIKAATSGVNELVSTTPDGDSTTTTAGNDTSSRLSSGDSITPADADTVLVDQDYVTAAVSKAVAEVTTTFNETLKHYAAEFHSQFAQLAEKHETDINELKLAHQRDLEVQAQSHQQALAAHKLDVESRLATIRMHFSGCRKVVGWYAVKQQKTNKKLTRRVKSLERRVNEMESLDSKLNEIASRLDEKISTSTEETLKTATSLIAEVSNRMDVKASDLEAKVMETAGKLTQLAKNVDGHSVKLEEAFSGIKRNEALYAGKLEAMKQDMVQMTAKELAVLKSQLDNQNNMLDKVKSLASNVDNQINKMNPAVAKLETEVVTLTKEHKEFKASVRSRLDGHDSQIGSKAEDVVVDTRLSTIERGLKLAMCKLEDAEQLKSRIDTLGEQVQLSLDTVMEQKVIVDLLTKLAVCEVVDDDTKKDDNDSDGDDSDSDDSDNDDDRGCYAEYYKPHLFRSMSQPNLNTDAFISTPDLL